MYYKVVEHFGMRYNEVMNIPLLNLL